MLKRTRAAAGHRRSFERAPCVRAGGTARWVRDDEKHPGWFFGTDADGVEGYFPADWFEIDRTEGVARARRDYDAMELTVKSGTGLEIVAEAAGWVLVRTPDGGLGWIPRSICADG